MDNSRQQVPIYTIGYGDRTLAEVIALLERHDIRYLIDVRSAPYSCFKPEFSRNSLGSELRGRGIRYLFLGKELGGRPMDREYYVGDKVDYEKVKEKRFFREGIERLNNAFRQQLRVMLMCSEGKPEQCHRSKLIGEALGEMNIPVCHIDEKGQLETQEAIIHRLTGGQLSLFGAPVFTSRKQYVPEEQEDDS